MILLLILALLTILSIVATVRELPRDGGPRPAPVRLSYLEQRRAREW